MYYQVCKMRRWISGTIFFEGNFERFVDILRHSFLKKASKIILAILDETNITLCRGIISSNQSFHDPAKHSVSSLEPNSPEFQVLSSFHFLAGWKE